MDVAQGMNAEEEKVSEETRYLLVDVNEIFERPDQPREGGNKGHHPESIRELAHSIESRGLKSAILVRPLVEEDRESFAQWTSLKVSHRYVLLAGSRRLAAFRSLGRLVIPALVDTRRREDRTEDMVDSLIENVQRVDLEWEEVASYLVRLRQEISVDGRQIRQKDIGKLVGKSQAWVNIHLKIADLSEVLRRAVQAKKISNAMVMSKLVKLEEKYPDEVAEFVKQKRITGPINMPMCKEFELNLSRKAEARKAKEQEAKEAEKAKPVEGASLASARRDGRRSKEDSSADVTGSEDAAADSAGPAAADTDDANVFGATPTAQKAASLFGTQQSTGAMVLILYDEWQSDNSVIAVRGMDGQQRVVSLDDIALKRVDWETPFGMLVRDRVKSTLI